MSTKPVPCALTACKLMAQAFILRHDDIQRLRITAESVANLASAIHRVAPACKRLAVAECNGGWGDGQRDACAFFAKNYGGTERARLAELDKSITDYATRLDRRIAKLNAELAPFGFKLIRSGDPRGATLRMAETPVDDSATHYSIG